jgi:hypothetical protein
LAEVEGIWCLSVKARMRSSEIVQHDERTPIGPRSARSFILGIRGQGASFIFMRRSRRRRAKWSAAAMTASRRVDCWNCRFGCSIGRLARRCGLRRSLRRISPRFRRCGHCSIRRRSAASRLGSHHQMLLFWEQQGSLTTRIGERSMRRQRQLRHDRRSGTQQFDLFATGSGGSAAPTPEWRTLPAPTRQALTALMTRLIVDYAVGDHRPGPRKVRHDI